MYLTPRRRPLFLLPVAGRVKILRVATAAASKISGFYVVTSHEARRCRRGSGRDDPRWYNETNKSSLVEAVKIASGPEPSRRLSRRGRAHHRRASRIVSSSSRIQLSAALASLETHFNIIMHVYMHIHIHIVVYVHIYVHILTCVRVYSIINV